MKEIKKQTIQNNGEFKKGNIPWNKDLKLSKEHIEKLRISHKGKIHNGTFKNGMTPWNKGKKGLQKCSEETKMKLSKIFKGRKIHTEEPSGSEQAACVQQKAEAVRVREIQVFQNRAAEGFRETVQYQGEICKEHKSSTELRVPERTPFRNNGSTNRCYRY